MQTDVIVVGCGVAGLHASYPLVKSGINVLMLDAGEPLSKKWGWHYPILGKRARYARQNKINGKIVVESFVPGGLSEIWGGVCERFNTEELSRAGLPDLNEHYEIVSKRIGLEGNISKYRGHTTLKELLTYPNFKYEKKFVREIPKGARFTLIACGAIGTAKLLGKQTKFYKKNSLHFCFSKRSLPLGGLKPINAQSVGESFVLFYHVLPHVVVADVRGPEVDLRKFGLLPIFHKNLPEGSTSHYAGGVEVDKNGKFSEGVYVTDSSGWKALPAKPIALTIMANANRIGTHIAALLSKTNHS